MNSDGFIKLDTIQPRQLRAPGFNVHHNVPPIDNKQLVGEVGQAALWEDMVHPE